METYWRALLEAPLASPRQYPCPTLRRLDRILPGADAGHWSHYLHVPPFG